MMSTFDMVAVIAIVMIIRPSFCINNSSKKTYSKPLQLCNFHNYPKIYPFLSQRWLSARKELNLTSYNISLVCKSDDKRCTEVRDRHETMINTFFKFTPQLALYNINGSVIGYGRIYKCASEGIMHNLNLYAREISHYETGKEYVLLNRDEIANLKHAIQYYENDNFTHTFNNSKPWHLTKEFKTRNQQFQSFAYIREPMRHFESGFSEAVYRTEGLVLNSAENIKHIIRDLLDYINIDDAKKPLNDLAHIFCMSGVYFNYDIDITLHAESFVDDWEIFVVPTYNLPAYTFDLESGFHDTSVNHPRVKKHEAAAVSLLTKANTTKVRTYLKNLRKQHPDAMRALCHLILIDYICFPEYKLPRSCAFLDQELIEGRKMLQL